MTLFLPVYFCNSLACNKTNMSYMYLYTFYVACTCIFQLRFMIVHDYKIMVIESVASFCHKSLYRYSTELRKLKKNNRNRTELNRFKTIRYI